MAMVARRPGPVSEYSPICEPNAVGKAATDFKKQGNEHLHNLANASVFWRRILLAQSAQQKLLELSYLGSNWDSYGAPSPNRHAIENAARVLEFMQLFDLENLSIVPSGEGGIGLCFRKKDRYADLETLNDGTTIGVRYAGMETPVLIAVAGTDSSIKTALEQIRNHIGT